MKTLILRVIALVALSAGALFAQNITGTWQGTLKAGPQELRSVVKISLDDDKLKAVLYSIDQGAQPLPFTTVTKDGTTIKMAIAGLGSYEGKLSADGNSITGTWTQGAPIALNLTRATPETAWTIPEPPPPPKFMPADAKPVFEVATIKPSKPDEGFSILLGRRGAGSNSLTTTATSLSDLMKFAYDLHPRQITNGPAWLETEKYDVIAKPDLDGLPSLPQMKAMLQKLLAERFELVFHRDKKELPVYAITVAKTGVKMTKHDGVTAGPGFGGGPKGFNVRSATMSEFASVLQAGILEQPVVDQTGLGDAKYDFILKWTPDGPQPPTAADVLDAPPDIFTAFQQQLGLKLESTKAPVDVLVIDKVEKPSEN